MPMLRFHALTAIFFLCALSIGSAATAPPLLVAGPHCSDATSRSHTYVMFEDRNGDGAYDYMIHVPYDGAIYGEDWTTDIEWDPFAPAVIEDLVIYNPPAIGDVICTLSSTRQSNGEYNWRLEMRRSSDNALVATFQRAGDRLACAIEPRFLR